MPQADIGYDFLVSVVAIHMPANTAISPKIRLRVIGSPTNWVASNPAAIGLTVIVLATRVGVALSRANTHRINASAPPPLKATSKAETLLGAGLDALSFGFAIFDSVRSPWWR